MSDQPPLPGRPPAWNSEDGPTLAYPAPNQHDGPQPPQHPQQQPSYQQPYGGQRSPYDPHQQVPWQQQPPSNQQPQQTYQQPQQGYQQPQAYYGQQQPQFMPPHGYQGGQPPAKSKKPWLVAGAIALVVALVGGVGAVLLTRSGGDDEAGTPVPTASYTDGLASAEPSPEPTETPSASPSEPTPTPTPSPTPTERRRTLKDVDKGLLVYDDVYVNPATGWRKDRRTKYSVTLGTQSHFGAAIVIVAPVGLPARSAVQSVAQELIDADHLTGVRKEPVKTLLPANSNIGAQAQLSYSGRYAAADGAVFSLVARCTSMTGVESIHNVTVTLCVAARKDTRDTVFRDGARMLASVARSI